VIKTHQIILFRAFPCLIYLKETSLKAPQQPPIFFSIKSS